MSSPPGLSPGPWSPGSGWISPKFFLIGSFELPHCCCWFQPKKHMPTRNPPNQVLVTNSPKMSQGYIALSCFIVLYPFLYIIPSCPQVRKQSQTMACWKIPQSVTNEVPFKKIALGFRHFPPFRPGLCCWSTGLSVRPRRTSVGQRPTIGVVTVRVAF